MILVQIAGTIAHGRPLERAGARTTVEVPVMQIETNEVIYRVASTPPGLDLRRDDLLVARAEE
jgi:hypothetical protein